MVRLGWRAGGGWWAYVLEGHDRAGVAAVVHVVGAISDMAIEDVNEEKRW